VTFPPPLSQFSEGGGMNFLELLKFLSAFGPKLKDIWADVQAILAAVKSIQEKLSPASEAGTLSSVSLTADEHAELDEIANLLGPTAVFDPASLLGFASLLGTSGGKATGLLLLQFLKAWLTNRS
jgi:hypothetical protein